MGTYGQEIHPRMLLQEHSLAPGKIKAYIVDNIRAFKGFCVHGCLGKMYIHTHCCIQEKVRLLNRDDLLESPDHSDTPENSQRFFPIIHIVAYKKR